MRRRAWRRARRVTLEMHCPTCDRTFLCVIEGDGSEDLAQGSAAGDPVAVARVEEMAEKFANTHRMECVA